MPERYTLSNRHDDKSRSPKSKSKSPNNSSSSVIGQPSLPASFWIVICIVAIVVSNIITYFVTTTILNKKASEAQQQVDNLQKQLVDAKNDPSNPNSPNSKNPGSASSSVPTDTRNKVQDAVSNNQYQDLSNLLSGNVTVVIGGTGSSVQSAQQAIESLNYLNGSSGSWNWNLTPEQLAQLQQGSNAQYFGNNAVVGQSENGYVVSIIVNENGQVETIFMAPTPQDAGASSTTGEGDE